MNETAASIVEWADATFGPVTSRPRAFSRLIEEVAELVKEVSMPARDDGKVMAEVADVVIVSARLASISGWAVNLDEAPYVFPEPHPRETLSDFLRRRASRIMFLALRGLDSRAWTQDEASVVMAGCVGIAGALRCDLQATVNAKMAKNRARTWVADGTGHGYHVKQA